jgi:hypothetical protein
MITDIAPGSTLASVLSKVTGGKVLHATYHETSKLHTQPAMTRDTAFIHFVHAKAAKTFVDSAKSNSITLLKAPRVHANPIMLAQIKENELSRVLYLLDNGSKVPEQVADKILLYDYGHLKTCRYPIATGRDKDGILYLEFAGIADAVNAKEVLGVMHWELGSMANGFLGDPCEKEVEGEVEGEGE